MKINGSFLEKVAMLLEESGNEYKIILVGNSGVGKTCLIRCFDKQPFEAGESAPTVAPTFTTASVLRRDGREVKLMIWDTSGQERFNSINRLFFRNAKVALMCFDGTERGEGVLTSLKTWRQSVKEESPDCILFVVVTKSDLIAPNEMEEVEVFTDHIVHELGAVAFYVTSAKQNTRVEVLFQSVAEQCGEVANLVQGVKLNWEVETVEKSSCSC